MTPEMDAGIPIGGNENASNSDDTQPSSNPSSDQLIDAMATAMRGIPEVPREIPNGPLDHFDPFTHGGPLGVHGMSRETLGGLRYSDHDEVAETVRERLAGFKDGLASRLDRIEKRLEQLMAMTSFVQHHINSFQPHLTQCDPIAQLNPAPQPSIGVDPQDPALGSQGLTEDEVKYLALLEERGAEPSPQTLCEQPAHCEFPNCVCDNVEQPAPPPAVAAYWLGERGKVYQLGGASAEPAARSITLLQSIEDHIKSVGKVEGGKAVYIHLTRNDLTLIATLLREQKLRNHTIGIHIDPPRDGDQDLPTTPTEHRARKVLSDLIGALKLLDEGEPGEPEGPRYGARVRLLFDYWDITGACVALKEALDRRARS